LASELTGSSLLREKKKNLIGLYRGQRIAELIHQKTYIIKKQVKIQVKKRLVKPGDDSCVLRVMPRKVSTS
jgi:hypothetical protein